MECPVCYDKFDCTAVRPLVLPCGHSLCKGCARQLMEPPSCPECRQLVCTAVDDLPTNLCLMQLAETKGVPLCEELRDESSARLTPSSQLTVISEIGRGVASIVYKAKWGKRQVALKLVRLPKSPAGTVSVLSRWILTKLKILHELTEECQNTCRIYGYTMHENELGVITKLYERGDLQSLLHRDGEVSVTRAVSYGLRIATALQELHQKGVIVAGLKPSSILLSDVGEPILAEFGIHKVLSSTGGQYNDTSRQDTANYRAPEQFQNNARITSKADIWAWACIMIHCLTGAPPWAQMTTEEIQSKVMDGAVPYIGTDLPPDVTPLATVLKACFSTDPSLRPTAAELVDQLQHISMQNLQQSTTATVVPANTPKEASCSRSVSTFIHACLQQGQAQTGKAKTVSAL